jgi:hypothetical protein
VAGDLVANRLTEAGLEKPIYKSDWRDSCGLDRIWAEVHLGDKPYRANESALINESRFYEWMGSRSRREAPPIPSAAPKAPSPAMDGDHAGDHQAVDKNRGGRPPSWDWDAFDREMMRLANTPDGLPDRPALQKHMLEWCERTWGKSPADSLFRDHISRKYPD